MRRPLQLYQPPHPIEIQKLNADSLPLFFSVDGEQHIVKHSWGPERIESGWWDSASQRRDYYRIETIHGTWLWLYRDLQQKAWYLHGVF